VCSGVVTRDGVVIDHREQSFTQAGDIEFRGGRAIDADFRGGVRAEITSPFVVRTARIRVRIDIQQAVRRTRGEKTPGVISGRKSWVHLTQFLPQSSDASAAPGRHGASPHCRRDPGARTCRRQDRRGR